MGVTSHGGFWSGKRVLLTGHTGFKGAWLTLILHRLGARISGLALQPSTERNLFHEAGLRAVIDDRRADIRDREAVRQEAARAEPDVVFHLAAQALVRASYVDPIGTFETNVMGTAHVLEALRSVDSVRAIVVVTSDKCYLNDGRPRGYVEADSLGGADPYSSSKAAAELVAAAYRSSFYRGARACGIATARAGNVIGGGDWAVDRLIPDLVRSFEAGAPLALRYPSARRPWQHVLEPLFGYTLLAERLFERPDELGEAWNFGPHDDDVATVSDVVDIAADAFGAPRTWQASRGDKLVEAESLRLDSSKAAARLGYRARLRLGEAVQWTMSWYRRHRAGESARALCEEQLSAFEARAG